MTGQPIDVFYPEVAVGGFSRVDSTMAFYIRLNALVTKEMTVVDLGAGRGAAHDEPPGFKTALRDFRGKCRKVIGVDIDEAVLANVSVDEAKLVGRDGTIPLPDASVDLIFADFTFEHVAEPEKFSAEIDRILKPGGWICARTPNKWGYIAIAARLVPNRAHVKMLHRLQPDRRNIDVFPTAYRLNTARALRQYFPDQKWERYAYTWNAEPAYFGHSVVAWGFMLALFRVLPAAMGSVLFFYGRKKAVNPPLVPDFGIVRTKEGDRLRLLYVGTLGPNDTATHRKWALERLGVEVSAFDTSPYVYHGGPRLSNLRGRLLVGPTVSRMNRDVLDQARSLRPDVIWFDKASYLRPHTAATLRAEGIYTVHFNIDNPFGPRNDPGGRLLRATVPCYDLHLVQRDVNLADYRNAGAEDVRIMRTAYEPTLHFPPPEGWSDANRVNDVVYIGAPYDRRVEFVVELWRRHGIATRIWGSPIWAKMLPADARAALWQGGQLWNDAYRETIWRSRICLAWVTHANCDDVAHKAFEIAACGGFLLAEDTPGHRAHFAADTEAVFFRSVEDCAALIRRYLPDEAARTRIGAAARRRAERSGYGNDARIAEVLDYIRLRLDARRKGRDAVTAVSRRA